MDIVESAVKRLVSTPGVVGCWVLPDEDRESIRQIETDANRRLGLPGLELINAGIEDILGRQRVVIISHSSQLRHPPGPIIVICDGDRVVGEEIWQACQLEELSNDSRALFLGKSLVLYRDKLVEAKGKPLRLTYKALPFPELEEVPGVRDVVSVTITIPVHSEFSRKAGWDPDNPDLGTVLIGFNESK